MKVAETMANIISSLNDLINGTNKIMATVTNLIKMSGETKHL
jgi:hypothetical protein